MFTSFGFSQISKSKSNFFEATALQTGYSYIGKNYGYVGFDKRIDNRKDWIYINLGAGTLIGKLDNKLEIVPEIHSNFTIMILMFDVSLTTKSVNPSLGFNIYNRIKIKSGYNLSFKEENFEGITFGININLGKEDYHYLAPIKFL